MRYALTCKAEDDVIEIFRSSVEQFGLQQAEHYHSLLAATFEFLAENPRAARERKEISPPVRVHPVGAHIVLYQLEGDEILIIRIRHAHEDWEGDAP
ncbi:MULTISPECIES: type II toxin-antitoxin system RelE/ParE family toxin [unclassified Thioalkalivibrio]|uniref:type II toxin-antitoxin system RelE/ParE family toxin n=1 Tax=unclassified Thioalkalivibrio TaxID=2621013 RepID=UPI000382228C|nr:MULTISPECIES: type II toxin-antitoxin system RelE/ParE family toxin [unclassified Thioalkalivibrio]